MYSVYPNPVFKTFRVEMNGVETDVLISKYPFGEPGGRGKFSMSLSFPLAHDVENGFSGTLLISDTFSFDTENERDKEFESVGPLDVVKMVEEKLKDFSY